jgi:hypothetical protein
MSDPTRSKPGWRTSCSVYQWSEHAFESHSPLPRSCRGAKSRSYCHTLSLPRSLFLKIVLVGGVSGLGLGHAAETLASAAELYTGRAFSDAFVNPVDHPDRPNVLLIGDSISIGYTVEVRKHFEGRADVFRIPTNGRDSAFGLEHLAAWLGSGTWDVIHFNWGLWDICYRHPESKVQGHRDKLNGTQTATPADYGENLARIVALLKSTDAKLIWGATTPVPENEAGRFVGDAIKYNQIAAKIMASQHIPIDDLHAHAQLRLPEIQKAVGDVHFTPEGYLHLAAQVAESIDSLLRD